METVTPYIVLARKHRPRQFHEVVGQGHVAQTLTNAIRQNRVAHALLFAGPRGVGKTSTARILSRALNCQDGPTPTPCGECSSCREILEGASTDVIEIDAASNRGIDEIRELREAVRYPPSRERYKVYIIDEVHMLTTQAFNALLKTLEEPPPHVKFVFATTEPHKIPDTILSRCQRFDFRRIKNDDIVGHLSGIASGEGVEVTTAALRIVARQSEGCMRDAQSLLDQLISFSDGKVDGGLAAQVLGVVGHDALLRLTLALLAGDVDGVLEVVQGAYEIGANLIRFTADLLEHLRDLTIAAAARSPSSLGHLSSDERAAVTAQAKTSDVTVLYRMFSVLAEAADEMSQSAFPRLLLEMALVRMTAIEPVQPLADLVSRLEAATLGSGGHRGGTGGSGREPVGSGSRAPSVPRGPRSTAQDAPTAAPRAPAATDVPPQPETAQRRPVEAKTPATSRAEQWAAANNREPATPAPKIEGAPQQPPTALATASDDASSADRTKRPVTPKVSETSAEVRPTPLVPVPAESEVPANTEAAVQPSGSQESRTPSASIPAELEGAEDPQRWRYLVDRICTGQRSVGELLKMATLIETPDSKFVVSLPGIHFDLLTQDDQKLKLIQRCAKDVFGDSASVRIQLRKDDGQEVAGFSVYEAEDREAEAERRRLTEVIEKHPVTSLVQQVFEVDPSRIRITPQLVERDASQLESDS